MRPVLASALTAFIAAFSSVICTYVAVPVWVMFIGWIAFVAGGMSLKSAAPTFICSIAGLVLGFLGAAIIGGGATALGADLALLIAVFVIVFAALCAQHIPVVSLVVCYFIGMTTFFASGLPPAGETLAVLGAGLLIGIVSGSVALILSGFIHSPETA